jgi:hypothetical protein
MDARHQLQVKDDPESTTGRYPSGDPGDRFERPDGARAQARGRMSGVRVPAEATRLYHLTPLANLESIVRNGIRAGSEGCIYLFNDLKAAPLIARDQVFARRFALFEIDVGGLEVEVETDVSLWVWEPYQRLIRQWLVPPQLLRLVGVFEAPRVATECDYARGERWGWGREVTTTVLELCDRFACGEIASPEFSLELRRLWQEHGRESGASTRFVRDRPRGPDPLPQLADRKDTEQNQVKPPDEGRPGDDE